MRIRWQNFCAVLCVVLTWPAQCLRGLEDNSRRELLLGEAGGLSAAVFRQVGIVPSILIHHDCPVSSPRTFFSSRFSVYQSQTVDIISR